MQRCFYSGRGPAGHGGGRVALRTGAVRRRPKAMPAIFTTTEGKSSGCVKCYPESLDRARCLIAAFSRWTIPFGAEVSIEFGGEGAPNIVLFDRAERSRNNIPSQFALRWRNVRALPSRAVRKSSYTSDDFQQSENDAQPDRRGRLPRCARSKSMICRLLRQCVVLKHPVHGRGNMVLG